MKTATNTPAPSPAPRAPVRLVLPWPPSVNHYWEIARNRYGGRHMAVSKAGKRYRDDVAAAVWSLPKRTRFEGRLEMTVTLFQSRKGRVCDLDNFNKGLLDALAKAGVYHNDNQIDRLTIVRGERCDDPRAEVSIRLSTTEDTEGAEKSRVAM